MASAADSNDLAKVISKGINIQGCSLCPFRNSDTRIVMKHTTLHNNLIKDGKFLNYRHRRVRPNTKTASQQVAVKRKRDRADVSSDSSNRDSSFTLKKKHPHNKKQNEVQHHSREGPRGLKNKMGIGSIDTIVENLRKVNHFEKILECDVCTFRTIDPDLLVEHSVFHTQEITNCPLCGVCPLQNRGRQYIFRHLVMSHSRIRWDFTEEELTRERVYPCSIRRCNFVCMKPETMDTHKKLHQNKSRKCPVEGCSYVGHYSGRINDHILAHFNDMPYKCPACNKNFCSVRVGFVHTQCIPTFCI